MKIAQIAPLYESVPPSFYGGTERIVSYLTEELVRQGHDVTLFASGDSITSARLVPACPRSLRLDSACADALAYHICMLENVARLADSFDVLHYHVDYLHFPWSRRSSRPHVTTLHGRLDLPELKPVYAEYDDMPLVSISASQRAPLADANWVGTVHHGIPIGPCLASGDRPYLAFLGRISPEKRLDRAVEIARRAGWPLRVAAKIDRADRAYFEREIAGLLEEPFVTYMGELGGRDRDEFLAHAHALLFPIDWAEPFGLVMIEAMVQGTPVIAWRGGSVEEVVTPGVTGFIVESIAEAVDAVAKVDTIDRAACRREVEQRFCVERMTADYLRIYERLIDERAIGAVRRADAGRVA